MKDQSILQGYTEPDLSIATGRHSQESRQDNKAAVSEKTAACFSAPGRCSAEAIAAVSPVRQRGLAPKPH